MSKWLNLMHSISCYSQILYRHIEKSKGSQRNAPNKAMQIDNLRGVCFVVSLSLHFTTKQTPHKLRLMAALYEIERHKLQVPLYINAFVEHSDYQYFIVRDRIEHNVLACIQ